MITIYVSDNYYPAQTLADEYIETYTYKSPPNRLRDDGVLIHFRSVKVRPGEAILMEFPEDRLGPLYQLELADLIIEWSNEHNVVFCTQSEAIILRILRRIREGKLQPDQVDVWFADDNKEPIRLNIDTDGEFVDQWPNGFFDWRAEELF